MTMTHSRSSYTRNGTNDPRTRSSGPNESPCNALIAVAHQVLEPCPLSSFGSRWLLTIKAAHHQSGGAQVTLTSVIGVCAHSKVNVFCLSEIIEARMPHPFSSGILLQMRLLVIVQIIG